ncbi:MAG: glutamate--cysteine ligase [Woeseiaceae bacterium]
MSKTFEKRVSRLAAASPSDILWGGLKGIEKESLRVRKDGYLSDRPHPDALGSALTNRYVTTDFSEALLEFVTPAFPNTWEALRFLCDIHQFCYEAMDDEFLWVTSMPCRIPEDAEIPLAYYGESNIGRMKTIYRNGLGYRYGRTMQTIAGVHFNYSLPTTFWPVYMDMERARTAEDEFRSSAYLGLIRNFRRYGWLILYLFGASPAVCKSFGKGAGPAMQTLNGETLYEPFGTSLRMSDLGYSNRTQARLDISLNNLDDYINDLNKAITRPEPLYERIGLREDGELRQLSVNQLQIENEYYSPIRPKRVAFSGERPTAALRRGGIEYVEVRSLDLNIFDPVGINQNVMRFMEAFLVYCLLKESPPFTKSSKKEAVRNHTRTAKRGRDPSFELLQNGKTVSLTDWAAEILREVRAIAELIDRGSEEDHYVHAVGAQLQLVTDSEFTPSARLLAELRQANASFFEFAMACADGHKQYFTELVQLSEDRQGEFANEAADSIRRQHQIEASDAISLDEYLDRWFNAN